MFVALLSLIATNVAGYTKKTTVAAIYLISYCAGNIIGLHHQLRINMGANGIEKARSVSDLTVSEFLSLLFLARQC